MGETCAIMRFPKILGYIALECSQSEWWGNIVGSKGPGSLLWGLKESKLSAPGDIRNEI